MEKNTEKTSIKFWAEDDKPREKLSLKGKSSLSNAELLAILIGSGNNDDSAVELCKKILQKIDNNLIELSKLSISDLTVHKGIGEAKAITIIAALEIGRRLRKSDSVQKDKITSSKDAFEIIHAAIDDFKFEEFWLLLMNNSNGVQKKIKISEGGVSQTIADPKKIFKFALENTASAIIVAHNHPSGKFQPSDEDIKLTKKLKEAGNLLDIKVLDHLIIGDNNYFSFADEGLI
ncbi:MAG: DNA repair protein RadC [Bacteroidetes bacterium]|nr:DNA repair protein RadC [Bacteroidota bacterium]